MTNNISCPLAMEGAKIVGACQGAFPDGSNSSGTRSGTVTLQFLNNNNKDIDFFVLTAYPSPTVAANTVSSSYSYGLAVTDPMPMQSVFFPTGSHTVMGYVENYGGNFTTNSAINHTISYDTNTSTFSYSATLYKCYGCKFSIVAYKYN